MQTVLKTNKTAWINSQETWLATNITNWLPWFSLSATLLRCFCIDKCNKCLASRFGWCTYKKMLEIKFKYFSVVIFLFSLFFWDFFQSLKPGYYDKQWIYFFLKLNWAVVACKNNRFSFLVTSGDISWGGMSATQRWKFHTHVMNQCLQNSSSSHGELNANLFNFTFLLVNFG